MGDKVTEHNIKKLLVCSGESEQFMNTEDFWKKKRLCGFLGIFLDILGKFVIYFISALDKKDSKHPLSSRIHRFSVNGIINYFKAEQTYFGLSL